MPAEAGALANQIIEVVQTHGSAVLLTATRAYKLKKPVNLEFLDYSTAERRRAFCLEECRVNQALAPGVYLGVAPILHTPGGAWAVGHVWPSGEAPQPADELQGGTVVDYAVVMRRLPESSTLATRIANGHVSAGLIRRVAHIVARFHASAERATTSDSRTPVDDVLANIHQTLDQSRADTGVLISQSTYAAVSAYLSTFSQRRRALLDARLRDGRIRDCHGDLRLEHVYITASADPSAEDDMTILIIDRIEFDPHFRIGDVAGEIAFLAVELEGAGRADLTREFVRAYIAETGDTGLLELLPFYSVYRALVRGKVRAMFAAQNTGSESAGASARAEAERMYVLAGRHATSPAEPTLALVGGLMGTGKSTLAGLLSSELGWAVLSSDITRKRLAGLPPTAPIAASNRRGLYTREWDSRVYLALRDEAAVLINSGHSVLIDATFGTMAFRAMMAEMARNARVDAKFLECVCSRDTALARLATRWERKLHAEDGVDPSIFASDGRPDLYDRQAARWQVFDPERESGIEHSLIDTSTSAPQQLEQALTALGVPHLDCALQLSGQSTP
ncbi:MAG TPA: AAA family ATPase [Ktedonobacterales bacterium]